MRENGAHGQSPGAHACGDFSYPVTAVTFRRIVVRKTIDLAAAVAAAEQHQAQPMTLGELVRAWSSATLDGSDTRLRKWVSAFGHLSAWDISSEQLDTAAHAMLTQGGYKPSAVNRDLSALGSAYRWAKERRLAPRGFRSPTLDVRRRDADIRRVEVSREHLDALRARARGFRDRRFGVFVELLIDTGARKSELLLRRWSDIDLERREIICEMTKTGVPRVLHFRDETAELIERVYTRRDPDALLFEGRVPGQQISYKKAWSTAVGDIGMPELRMHDIRHVTAARLLRSGVTLPVAAQVMGNSPEVLAERYGHLETGALRDAQERSWRASP
jgi:integrase